MAGYGVYVDIGGVGNTRYYLYADKSPGNKEYIQGFDYIISDVNFSASEPGIVIKSVDNVFGNKASINFNPPNPDTSINQLNGGQSKVDVVFAFSNDLNTTRTVSINTSGLIEVK